VRDFVARRINDKLALFKRNRLLKKLRVLAQQQQLNLFDLLASLRGPKLRPTARLIKASSPTTSKYKSLS
jgi:hypothetical protein